MTPATLIVTSLMVLPPPPTWGIAPALAFERSPTDHLSGPTVAKALTAIRKTPTIISGSSGGPLYIAFESPEEGRRAAIEKLQNRVAEFKINALPQSNDFDREQICLAAELTMRLISEIPNDLPLPKVMLLSSQVSLYWDFGQTYAELAVSGNGQLSIYGRRLGRSDVLVDTTFARLRASGLSFPDDLHKILML